MVVSIRVDDRLIHGQVALVWTKELGTTGVLVANDHAAQDDVTRMTLQMATPSGQKLLVKPVAGAVSVINDPRGQEMRIFALTNCVKDALTLVESCPGRIGSVNVANAGRFDSSPASEKVSLCSTVMLNSSELEAAQRLAACDLPVYCQVIPQHKQVPLKELLKAAKKNK